MNLEKNILSYLVDNTDKILEATEYLNEQCFQDHQCRLIWCAILELNNQNKAIDVFSVTKLNPNIKELAFFSLSNDTLTDDTTLTMHLELLRAESVRNQFKEITTKALHEIDKPINEAETLTNTIKELNELYTFGSNKQVKTINNSLEEIKQQIIDAKNGVSNAYNVGIEAVDKIYSFAPSDLVLIGARPAMGKTALLVSMFNYALYKGKKPCMFSLEMSTEQILLRMLSERLQTQSWKMKQGVCDMAMFEKHQQEINNMMPVIIDNCFKIDEIEAQVNKQYNLGSRIAFIDYLGLINPPKAQSREQEVSQITRRLKMLAKKLNIPIVLLSQLSRAVENRTNKRPMLSDLRDSGGVEQDADSVMFLYRDEYYGIFENDQGSTVDKAEIIIAKNRHGMVGTAVVDFIKEYTSFPNKLITKTREIDDYYERNAIAPNLEF
jgi:replicative DNA helicase